MSIQSGKRPPESGEETAIFTDLNHVRLMRHAKLVPKGHMPEARGRIINVILLGWVPLFVLSIAQELVRQDASLQAFLTDIAVHARMLVAVPLLIVAEYFARPHLEAAAWHFVDSNMIDDTRIPWYRQLAESSRRLGKSVWPSLWLGIIVYALVAVMAFTVDPTEFPTWYHTKDGSHLSWAGWWHMLVSQPLMLGLLLAWLWRLFIWVRFLKHIANEDLQLVASHPDKAGGLEFLSHTPRAFAPVALAIAVIVAGTLANKVFYEGVQPMDHKGIPIVTVIAVLLLFLTPPLVFSGRLRHVRIRGIYEYGMLASHLGTAFERKWLGKEAQVDSDSLSQPDFSATVDLYGVASNVYEMTPAIISRQTVLMLVAATLAPFVPIWLTAIPLQTILKAMMGMLV